MAVQNSLARQDQSMKLAVYLQNDAVKKQINQVVGGKNGTRFISSIVSAVQSTPALQDQERFLIELQANFIESDDLTVLKQVAGNIESGTTANYDDDGVSQKTTIKSGIANKTDVIVPNPVKLRPYRTFAEIEQPQSSYVFRIQDSDRGPSFKLVEADGGLWKNATMKKIKEYLAYELAEELEKYHITIIA